MCFPVNRRDRSTHRIAIAIVSLVWAVGIWLSGTPAGGVAGFGDVEPDRFYNSPVQWLVDNDLTTGTSATCFSPDDVVTRGQAAVFLWRLADRPDAPPHAFDDVSAPWQQAAVSWLADSGATTGTSPTTFSPDDPATRGQLATLLWRLEGSPAAPRSGFTDVTRPWQIVPVDWLADTGATTGTSPTTFSPDDPATRGQLASLLWRLEGSPAVVIDPASPLCGSQGVVSGEAVYATNCAVCHGFDGSGGFGPSLIDSDHTTSEIAEIVELGQFGGMPAFGDLLSPAEIGAVAEYVSGL